MKLLTTLVCVGALVAFATKTMAENINTMENNGTASSVTIDSSPIVTFIGSAVGANANAGHTYTSWAVFVQDSSGGADLFASSANMAAAGYTPTVGDALTISAKYAPFDGLAELEAPITSITVNSQGNALPTPQIITASQAAAATNTLLGVSLPYNIASTLVEIQNATISGSTGGFMTTFPSYTTGGNNTIAESYTLTDGGGSVEMFDWITSYSACGNLGGTAVPTGPVNVTGFVDSFGEFVPFSIVSVPEPTSLTLIGFGVLGLLAVARRRRK